MSAKINLYSGLVTGGSGTAVEPKPGYVYVVTKVTFRNESDNAGVVSAKSPGREPLVEASLPARRETGWEGTLVVEYGELLIVTASPSESIRCIVEGYFLLDVPAFARRGAGAMDEAYASDGAIEVKDSPLAKLTYLTLVELKRVRMLLEVQSGSGSDRDQAAEESDRELGV
jgi:hypothetical protein